MKLIVMLETAKKAEEKLKHELNYAKTVLFKELIKTFNNGHHKRSKDSHYSVN